MKLSEYLRENADRVYRYAGTTWGDEGFWATSNQIAAMLEELDYDAEMADIHPIYGVQRDDEGQVVPVYFAGLNGQWIGYYAHLIQDIVLELDAYFYYEGGVWFLSGEDTDGNYYETDNYEASSREEAEEAAVEYLRAYHESV